MPDTPTSPTERAAPTPPAAATGAGSAPGRRLHNPLHRRLPRQLRAEAGHYLAVFLLLLCVTALGAGFLSAAASLKVLTADMARRYNVEDARITTSAPLSATQLEAASQAGATLHDLASVDLPLELDAANLAPGQDPGSKVTLRVSRERESVNLAALHRGRAPRAANEIALDDTFATLHHIEVGQEVTAGSLRLRVSGIVTLPDYAALFPSSSRLLPDTLTFAVATVSPAGWEHLEAAQGSTTNHTWALVLDPGTAADTQARTGADGARLTDGDGRLSQAERHKVEVDCARRLVATGAEVTSVLDAQENLGISHAANDLDGDSSFMTILLVVIIAVIGFVLTVTTSASIEAQSAVIGTLLASGWRRGELVRHYLTLPLLVGVAACALGNVVGYTWMTLPMRNLYYHSYSLPPYEQTFSWGALAVSTLLPLGLLVGITLVGLVHALRRTPLQFLRHERRRRSHRVVPLPAWLPFRTRFRLRLFLRSLPALGALLVGVALSSFLLLSGLVMVPVVGQFSRDAVAAMPAPHMYVLTPAASQQAAALSPGGQGVDQVRLEGLSVERRWGAGPLDVQVLGVPEGAYHLGDVDTSGEKVTIGVGLSNKTGLGVGDEITLTNRFTGESYRLGVDQVRQKSTDTRVYLSRERLSSLLGEPQGSWNTLLSDTALELPEGSVARQVDEADMADVAAQATSAVGGVMRWVTWLSVVVFLLVVHLLTRVVIARGARTISLLKVLGYTSAEVSSLYVRTITVTVVVSLLACPPLIVSGVRLVLARALVSYEADLAVSVPLRLVALEVGIALAAYALVALAHLRRVRRVPLSEALKVQE